MIDLLDPELGPEFAAEPASPTMLDEAPMPGPSQNRRMLTAWTPTDRRRLGFLSTRSYERSALTLPTDLWSYQQLFIDQQRDRNNPWNSGSTQN